MRPSLTLLRSLHLFPSFLVTLLTMAIVPLADRQSPTSTYLTLGLGMLLFQFTIGLVNDIVDIEDDRAAKPRKPLVRYGISRIAPVILATGMAVAGLVITLRLSREAWAIGVLGLLCGLSYDVYFKRTEWSWLPYSVAFPLVPIWVYVALDSWRAMMWWALPLGAVLGIALQLANQAPDVAPGQALGLPGRLGERRSRRLAVGLFEGVACLVAMLLCFESVILAAGAGVEAASVLALSMGATRLLRRDGLFHLLALGSAILAVLFLAAA